jgi:ComF family protein
MGLLSVNHLLDVIFPRACAGCGGRVDGEFLYLCWNCLASIKLLTPPYCALCGDPVYGDLMGKYSCSACLNKKPHFDCARSAAIYSGLIKEMILDFKYRDAVWLGPDLGKLMLACLRQNFNEANIDYITFVPLHKSKERTRTYNQALLLANEIAANIRKKSVNCLGRVRATATQTHLTAAERAANVRNKFTFKANTALNGKSILLVDDVMTTGATVNECARVLKGAGAREVLVLTAARG